MSAGKILASAGKKKVQSWESGQILCRQGKFWLQQEKQK
jgi:hypothetical protein